MKSENLEKNILAKASYWATSTDFDKGTNRHVQKLLDEGRTIELTDSFYRDLEFGTGGLRGILGPGTARMNIYNVRRAATALSLYTLQQTQNKKSRVSIAITFDCRLFSHEFAKAAAEVFANFGIHSYITEELRPVPMLSFMVRKYGCTAGVCVTASHNPPNYNGLKVYWGEGSQLVPPHDVGIIEIYNKTESYGDLRYLDYSVALAKGLVTVVSKELDDDYFFHVEGLALHRTERSPIKIVYSPLHGTGFYPVTECLKRFGFQDVEVVASQKEPDGHFPTVTAPNPEDPQAMSLAVEQAKAHGADLVLATDPDTDRIGMVVRENGNYKRFNGNQTICLLTEYILSSQKMLKQLPAKGYVIKTVVTTELMRDISEHYQIRCDETLTGFKWICDLINRYEVSPEHRGSQFICGGEESYGFLAGDFVRDKDAVISCCVAAEMLAFYKKQGKTLSDVMDTLFLRHGVYDDDLYTLTLPGQSGAQQIANLMDRLRTNPPTVIGGIDVSILRDFANSQEYQKIKNAFEPTASLRFPSSNVLQLILADGCKISARPSGTEPKIKFYFSVHAEVADEKSLARAKTLATEKLASIKSAFIEMANEKH